MGLLDDAWLDSGICAEMRYDRITATAHIWTPGSHAELWWHFSRRPLELELTRAVSGTHRKLLLGREILPDC